MNRLLRAKHWQLFLLLFVIPFGTQMIWMSVIFSSALLHKDIIPSATIFLVVSILMGIIMMVLFFSWMWTLGTFLHRKLPEGVHMNIARFKRNMIMPLIYIVVLFLCMPLFAMSFATMPWFAFLIIIPMHLFCMYCMIYTLYFIAKALTSILHNRAVTFSDYLGNFFLIWFWPIGIWVIQPWINDIAATQTEIN